LHPDQYDDDGLGFILISSTHFFSMVTKKEEEEGAYVFSHMPEPQTDEKHWLLLE